MNSKKNVREKASCNFKQSFLFRLFKASLSANAEVASVFVLRMTAP